MGDLIVRHDVIPDSKDSMKLMSSSNIVSQVIF